MSIIGSARINEFGRTTGGKAGDQTTQEVSTQAFYVHSKGWFILRPKDDKIADALAKAMNDACANQHIGYCQTHRTTILTMYDKYGSLEAIQEDCETDCSELVRVCIYQATGRKLNDFTTATERAVLLASGFFTSEMYNAKSRLEEGDVLVTKTKGHTAIVVSGSSRTSKKSTMPTLKLGSRGDVVKTWQAICGTKQDGIFGKNTRYATIIWQKAHGLVADGIVGKKTWSAAGY